MFHEGAEFPLIDNNGWTPSWQNCLEPCRVGRRTNTRVQQSLIRLNTSKSARVLVLRKREVRGRDRLRFE